ncbi:DUF742 domain-containing protein [Streptomyces benahoarensis]|uniref:DUF742 domain-containing protein n=1 Tax=Streptomyces benahoarensis TaxID=2595054 RepID=A0A553XM02_9ACTN|nr:DUF742 domain-containing protein [Streptomyces benahoarensis]TSB15171.1 DUF742 domain-containing protein [Streptomyces benahoarensis]TSB18014.1 DUF742 domain-containing protein [Streptomyces benahoarensis]
MKRLGPDDDPDRLYTVTGGRSRAADDLTLDLVTLIVSECDPAPGMQSEHVRILSMCHHPMAVVEVSAELRMPVSVVRILLSDLLDSGRVTARHPRPVTAAHLPDTDLLKEVLDALHRL